MNDKKPTQKSIIEKLTEKVDNEPIKCSICNQSNFTILDKFINQPVMDEISGNFVIGGPSLPMAVLVCNNCGNTYFVNLNVLGFINETK
jgi:transcription elongation factor Elf1